MKSAVTISRVPEAAKGPFVFRDPLPESFAHAASLGFDAVELFLPGPDFVSVDEVLALADANHLSIAAVGTGAGMLRYGYSITDMDEVKREAAIEFVLSMIDFGGRLGAPAILGSMQGKTAAGMDRSEALDLLASGLRRCDERAAHHGVKFIYEPLNRYETDLFNRLPEAARFLDEHRLGNVVLLADLFHMNIEESDVPQSIRDAGHRIGHVHFADSNRHAIGYGHSNAETAVAALNEIGYRGYLSAEILPLPDSMTAARQTIQSIRSLLQTP
jgi:sugar phosphate isomerase/epimerase